MEKREVEVKVEVETARVAATLFFQEIPFFCKTVLSKIHVTSTSTSSSNNTVLELSNDTLSPLLD